MGHGDQGIGDARAETCQRLCVGVAAIERRSEQLEFQQCPAQLLCPRHAAQVHLGALAAPRPCVTRSQQVDGRVLQSRAERSSLPASPIASRYSSQSSLLMPARAVNQTSFMPPVGLCTDVGSALTVACSSR